MASYEAQIKVSAVISPAERALQKLSDQLDRLQKAAQKILRPAPLRLDTRGAERQIAGLQRQIAGISSVQTVRVRVIREVEDRYLGGSGSTSGGGAGGGGMGLALVGAAAGAGLASRRQRALPPAGASTAALAGLLSAETTRTLRGVQNYVETTGKTVEALAKSGDAVVSGGRRLVQAELQMRQLEMQLSKAGPARNIPTRVRDITPQQITSYQPNAYRFPAQRPSDNAFYDRWRYRQTDRGPGSFFMGTQPARTNGLGRQLSEFHIARESGKGSLTELQAELQKFFLTAEKGVITFSGLTPRLNKIYQRQLEAMKLPYQADAATGFRMQLPLRSQLTTARSAGPFVPPMSGPMAPRTLAQRYQAGSIGFLGSRAGGGGAGGAGGGGGRPPATPPAGPGGRDPSTSFTRQRSAAEGLSGELGRLALAYLSVDTAVRAVTSTLQQGIAYDTATAKLKNLSAGFGETSEVMALTEVSASRFGQGITETSDQMAQLYGRLRPLGLSLTEIESVFTGFNTAARLSGSTAAESAGALLQLTQALGSGALRGAELNSVLEQAPLVAQAIAREMNQPIGALKKLAEEGALTSDIVVRALAKIGAEGGPKLAASLDTSAQKVKNLQNAFERLQIALSKLALPALLQTLEGITGQLDKGAKFATNLGDAWYYVASQLAPVVALYERLSNNPLARAAQAAGGFMLQNTGPGIGLRALGILNNDVPNAVGGLAQQGRDARQRNFIGPATPGWYGPAPRNVPTTPLQQRLGVDPGGSGTKESKAVEEAVRRGVIGGMTGGGQSDASRGRSTGPHLHAQLVRGNNLESLVDAALDFGGGRTASSFGLGRGAAAHGYPGRDYYTPQGSPFTLRAGWQAQDLGIQGALGRGMRVSGPGGVFELGHLQGVKTGDMNGKGAAGDLLDAQQDALNAAIEFQAKQQEQLATSKALLAVAQQDLLIAQTRDPLKRAELEGEKVQLEIKQRYAELLTNAISAEETLNLQLAERAELERAATEAMGAYIKALYEALGVAELLSSEVEKFGPKAFGGPTIPEGVNPYDPKMPNLNPGSGSGDREKAQGEYDRVKTELEKLNDPVNQITNGAEAIGTAFGTAFKDVASGAKSAQQALADAFQGIANHFLDMASQMIAKYIEMQVIGLAMNFLSSAATGAAGAGGFTFGGGGSGSSMFMPGAPTFFAEGGLVTGPTKAIIGEAGPEAVIPLEKLPSVMDRYNPGRATSLREQMAAEGGGPGGSGGSSPITLNVTATRIADDNWVKVDDLQVALAETRRQAAAEGAKTGEARTLSRLQQSPSTRRRLGM